MKVLTDVRPADSSNGNSNLGEAPTAPEGIFLALTTTKLLVADRLIRALIDGPTPSLGILGPRLAGEAFKEICGAIDEAIGGVVDEQWTRRYREWARVYRDAHVRRTLGLDYGAPRRRRIHTTMRNARHWTMKRNHYARGPRG